MSLRGSHAFLHRLKPDARRSFVEISKLLGSKQKTRSVDTAVLVSRRHVHVGSRTRVDRLESAAGSHFLQSYKTTLDFSRATHQIKDLTGLNAPAGQEIHVHGYLGEQVDLSKNLTFVPLFSKELNHSIQIISGKNAGATVGPVHAALRSVRPHSPVVVRGILKRREPATVEETDVLKIKDYEIELTGLQELNHFPKDILFKADTQFPPEQRHLQIRADRRIRDALDFRSRAAATCRHELLTNAFTEIETPLLFKSTPEGAREFVVPTRRKGLAYALPQSPQQYKQILMASGVCRYYQLAKCFRDEDLRADRQPEFTQLDLEMSFATGEDVMRCVESLIDRLWTELLGVRSALPPFPRMSYEESMKRYGSDKPDLRIGMEISDVGHLLPPDLVGMITSAPHPTVEAVVMRVSEDAARTRAFVKGFMDAPEAGPFHANPDGGPGIFVVDPRKPLHGLQAFGFEAAETVQEDLGLEEGDLVILQARKRAPHSGGSTMLGNLRLALHRAAVTQGHLAAPQGFSFLWVNDFPLFTPTTDAEPGQGGSAGITSTHHPFTSPKTAEDVDLLLTDPTRAKADHYDLVVNGVELGGGSRRIHDARVQEFVLTDVLKMSPDRLAQFSHLLDVLRAGCPPHAGIALGFDRLVAVMLGRDSVRDVIAFPKSGRGEDALVKSPSALSDDALQTYHLRLRE